MLLKKKLLLIKNTCIDKGPASSGFYSVEAALSLTIFTALIMFLISLIPIIELRSVIGHAANEVAIELSGDAYDTEKFFEEKGAFDDDSYWCAALIKEKLKNESNDPDKWLKTKGVIGGINGLDFSDSEIVELNSEIVISIKYEILINAFGITDKTVPIRTIARTKAWLPYDFSFESMLDDEGTGIWQKNELARGKYFVKRIKALNGKNGVKSGQGIDLYDKDEKKASEIFSMNIFSKTYLPDGVSIDTDAVLKQFEKYIKDFSYDIDSLGKTIEMDNGEEQEFSIEKREMIVIFPLEAKSPVYSGVLDAIFIELNETYGIEATLFYLEEANYEPG